MRLLNSHILSTIVVLLIVVDHASNALCPNKCSGHGTCGDAEKCICFDGWNGGAADCSHREASLVSFFYTPFPVHDFPDLVTDIFSSSCSSFLFLFFMKYCPK